MKGLTCPSCGRALRAKVSLFLDIPSELVHRLSKGNLRRRDVQVDGADWPRMTLYCENIRCKRPFVSGRPKPRRPKFEAIPDYGSHMTLTNFTECCRAGVLTSDDGDGCWATATRMSQRTVDCSQPDRAPKWATHVVWFNK